MSQFNKTFAITGLLGITLFTATSAQAHHSYNPTGYDSTAGYSIGGQDGGNPGATSTNTGVGSGSWGGPGLAYVGDLQAMWFASFHTDDETHFLSTAEALSRAWDDDNSNTTAGISFPANFELAVGGKAWQDTASQGTDTGWGHGMDFGLIKFSHDVASFSITVANDGVSNLLPAFSLYSGWDQGGGFRHQEYVNNIDNPLGTTGLTLIGAVANNGFSNSVSSTFTGLAAGQYSLFIGGDDSLSAGRYTVSMTASPVPVPGAIWLFGSVIAGLVGFNRRKQITA